MNPYLGAPEESPIILIGHSMGDLGENVIPSPLLIAIFNDSTSKLIVRLCSD